MATQTELATILNNNQQINTTRSAVVSVAHDLVQTGGNPSKAEWAKLALSGDQLGESRAAWAYIVGKLRDDTVEEILSISDADRLNYVNEYVDNVAI